MYAHCLFCNAALGRNDVLETFPVGRRFAYDAAKGRLWVVCHACQRWNLTPLEERWEAIDAAERLYRGTRLRASTENVGLARVAGGIDLVRVGRALLPEFAAWRYGSQLTARRRRHAVQSVPAIVIGGAGFAASIAASVYEQQSLAGAFGAVGGFFAIVGVRAAVDRFASFAELHTRHAMIGSPATVAAHVSAAVADGRRARLAVRRGHLAESTLSIGVGGELSLDIRHDGGRADLRGADARRAATQLSLALNPTGATHATVTDAVRAIAVRGGPTEYLALAGRWIGKATRPMSNAPAEWTIESRIPNEGLYALEPTQRLALEIVLHEDAERRAMDGELAALERAWQDAEEIAAIADGLALPRSVERSFARLASERRPPA